LISNPKTNVNDNKESKKDTEDYRKLTLNKNMDINKKK
jgi:hypothetical protein